MGRKVVEIKDHQDRIIGIGNDQDLGLFLRQEDALCGQRLEIDLLKKLKTLDGLLISIKLQSAVIERGSEKGFVWQTEDRLNGGRRFKQQIRLRGIGEADQFATRERDKNICVLIETRIDDLFFLASSSSWPD